MKKKYLHYILVQQINIPVDLDLLRLSRQRQQIQQNINDTMTTVKDIASSTCILSDVK